jgi:hypothetical protein
MPGPATTARCAVREPRPEKQALACRQSSGSCVRWRPSPPWRRRVRAPRRDSPRAAVPARAPARRAARGSSRPLRRDGQDGMAWQRKRAAFELAAPLVVGKQHVAPPHRRRRKQKRQTLSSPLSDSARSDSAEALPATPAALGTASRATALWKRTQRLGAAPGERAVWRCLLLVPSRGL